MATRLPRCAPNAAKTSSSATPTNRTLLPTCSALASPLYADPEPYLYQLPEMQPIHDYFEEHRLANFVAMLDQRARLEPLRRVYEFWIQTPLMRGQPINAALKHWCRRMGLAAGPVRRPLRELTASQAAALDADLDTAFQSALGAKPEALA